jgi:hypothetical protein
MTTMQECGPADCYFGYFNGEQGDSVFVGYKLLMQILNQTNRSSCAQYTSRRISLFDKFVN